jgi:hypothetical protein
MFQEARYRERYLGIDAPGNPTATMGRWSRHSGLRNKFRGVNMQDLRMLRSAGDHPLQVA